MEKIRIGYDDNLGLPNDFSEKIQCEIFSYHDLGLCINDFNNKKLDAIFIPAGTLPYLDADTYEFIAQSLFSSKQMDFLKSIFVTTKNITLENVADFTLGRVNKYCTTSYWAPSIYLMQFLPKNTKLKFENTDGFKDMLLKTAAGTIDGSMVWDIILEQNLSAAEKVRQLFFLDTLPTPVIVGRTDFPANFRSRITNFKSTDKEAFFGCFQESNIIQIKKFLSQIKDAISFYDIDLKK